MGRVFAARFMSFSAGEALAYPIGGLVVDAAGPRSTYLLAGATTAVAGVLILFLLAIPEKTRQNHRGGV
jgi:predicted MFS family arabinose efflux permease